LLQSWLIACDVFDITCDLEVQPPPSLPPAYSPPSLRFMPSFEVAIREFARVLKPGGLFAGTVWQSEDKAPFFQVTMGLAACEQGGLGRRPTV